MTPEALKFARDMLSLGNPLDRDGYVTGFIRRRALARGWSRFLADRIVVGPVSTAQPRERGFDLGGVDVRKMVDDLRLVFPVNVFGVRSVAVPAGLSEEGIPQSVQVIGPAFGERMVLAAAEVIEAELGTIAPSCGI